MLMPKLILKTKKNIILIHFWVKYILKNNDFHTFRHLLKEKEKEDVKYM